MSSVTDLVAAYDELVLAGDAPEVEDFCERHPDHPTLLPRLQELTRLRNDLDSLFTERAEAPAADGIELPGFRIIRQLGAGGMGTVYLAEQHSPRRLCAVKLVDHPHRSALDRFRREADLAARLSHRNIAAVYTFGVHEGQAFMATEMVHGFSLRALLRAADLVSPDDPNQWFVEAVRRLSEGVERQGAPIAHAPVEAMVQLAVQIANALAHAHQRGVIHRDVKPSNIIVTLDGHAKLIDFGIAVQSEEDDDRLTRTGTFIGSHGYSAPEQLRGEHDKVGPWTDTYALGATLYEMLTQRTPFEAPTYADRLKRADEMPIVGPRYHNSKVPRALDALVMRALDPEPSQRFHDGEELSEALHACPVKPSLLPGLPTHHLTRFVPRTVVQWLALLAVLYGAGITYLYVGSQLRFEQLEARTQAIEIIAGNSLLDNVVHDKKVQLERCLVFDRRLDGRPAPAAQLSADIVVQRGYVDRVDVTEKTYNMGARAKECMAKELTGLELPGIGLMGERILHLDLRVSSGP